MVRCEAATARRERLYHSDDRPLYNDQTKGSTGAFMGLKLAVSVIGFVAAFASPSQGQSGWTKEEKSSQVDGSKTILVHRDANQPITTLFGRTATPFFVVACHRGESRAYINWGTTLDGLYGQTVSFRVDDEKPRSNWWNVSTDFSALGYWGPGAINFVRQLIGARKIYVRAAKNRGGDAETSFDLDGLEEAIRPIADACKWPEVKLGISEIERQQIVKQVSTCWAIPSHPEIPKDTAVTLRLSMHRNGSVQDARIAEQERMQQEAFRVFAESAVRAVTDQKCGPFKLPVEQFIRWRTIELRFALPLKSPAPKPRGSKGANTPGDGPATPAKPIKPN